MSTRPFVSFLVATAVLASGSFAQLAPQGSPQGQTTAGDQHARGQLADPDGPPPFGWTLTLGGDSQFDSATALAPTADGGLFVVGRSEPLGASGADLWAARLTAWGGVLWEGRLAGQLYDDVEDVVATPDGGCLVVGWTYSFGAGDADGWAVKFSGSGTVQWQRTYGDVGDDRFQAVALSPDGFYVGGQFTAPPAAPDGGGSTGADGWLLELDDTGDVLWQQRFVGDGNDKITTLTPTAEGVAVSADSNSQFHAPEGLIAFRPWVVSLDGDGGVLWQKTYNFSGGDRFLQIVALDDGGFVLAGEIVGTGFFGGDAWVVKLDSEGDVVWDRRFGDHFGILDADIAVAVEPVGDGGFAVLGSTLTAGNGSQDLWFLKLAADGSLEWETTYGGPQFDQAEAMGLASHGDLYLAGRFQFLPAQAPHVLVMRLRADGAVGPHCDLTSATAPRLWTDPLQVDAVSVVPVATSVVPAASTAPLDLLDRVPALCPVSGGDAERR